MAEKKAPEKNSTGWDRINPYVSWALGPGRPYYFVPGQQDCGKEVMPILLRLWSSKASAFLSGKLLVDKTRQAEWRGAFKVLCRRNKATEKGEAVVWVAALASEAVVREMALPRARRAIAGASLGLPLSTAAVAALTTLAEAIPEWLVSGDSGTIFEAPAIPPAVVMGIIDDGIAAMHERFQRPGKATRVEHFWRQDPPLNLTRLQIEGFLGSGRDEDDLYRAANLVSFVAPEHKSVAWRVAHGTHVMDLACGYDPADDNDTRPIVCVQLPSKDTAAAAPWSLSFDVILGILHILLMSLKIAADRGVNTLPVVINVSYGLVAAWHEGLDLLGTFITDVAAICEDAGIALSVVLPAGNSYLSRGHAQTSFAAIGETRRLDWHIRPDDRTPSFLEVWLPAAIPTKKRVKVRITSPTGVANQILEHATAPVTFKVGANEYARMTWLDVPASNRAVFTIMVQPTAHPDPNSPLSLLAPAGIWKIELVYTGDLPPNQLVHAWVRRDDWIYGYPLRGRQSWLDDGQYQRFDHAGRDNEIESGTSLIRREYTLNSMATRARPIVIGGYLGKEKVAAKYSAAGTVDLTGNPLPALPKPQDRTPMRWPDAMAVSEDSRVHRGVLAAGSRSGSVVAMSGTSVAAPQIARLIADNLAAGPGDHDWVQGQAEPPGMAPPPKPRDERGGAGRIPTAPIVRVNRFD